MGEIMAAAVARPVVHVSQEVDLRQAPDVEVGQQQKKGCSVCRSSAASSPLKYGICLDAYGAGWKALLCKRCGGDFKRSRLPISSPAGARNAVAPPLIPDVHAGALRDPAGGAGDLMGAGGEGLGLQMGVGRIGVPALPGRGGAESAMGLRGTEGGAASGGGVRGQKLRGACGETLLSLNRRCYMCTRHATFGPPGARRSEAIHCSQVEREQKGGGGKEGEGKKRGRKRGSTYLNLKPFTVNPKSQTRGPRDSNTDLKPQTSMPSAPSGR